MINKENYINESYHNNELFVNHSSMSVSSTLVKSHTESNRRSSLFTSARGKQITVSDEAIQRTKSIFNEDSSSFPKPIIQEKSRNVTTATVIPTTSSKSSLFTSAGGKQIHISDAAKRRASQMFEENSSNDLHNKRPKSVTTSMISASSTLGQIRDVVSLPKVEASPSYHSWIYTLFNQETLLSDPITLSRDFLKSTSALEQTKLIERLNLLSKLNSSNALEVKFSDGIHFEFGKNCEIVSMVENQLGSKLHLWIQMQLRWIIWTLASHERKTTELASKLLTEDNVIHCIRTRFQIYNRLLPTVSRNPTRVQPIVSSAEHFSKAGVMSHLERCCDIKLLTWPLIVCFSIQDGEYLITDGWWWNKVLLDRGLKELIFKRKLKDGTKIIIFNCSFVSQDKDAEIRLNYNNVRKAKGNCRLAYCHPRFLHQCISIKSISPDGGPVYAICGLIVYVSDLMMSYHISDKSNITLSSNMSKLWDNIIQQKKAKHIESFYDSEIQNLFIEALDNISCESWLYNAMIDISKGNGIRSQLNELQIKLVQETYENLNQAVQVEINKELRDVSKSYDFPMKTYRDVLLQCHLSNELAWVRLPDSQMNISEDTISSNIIVNRDVMILGIVPSQRLSSGKLLLYPAKSFTMKYLTQITKNSENLKTLNVLNHLNVQAHLLRNLYNEIRCQNAIVLLEFSCLCFLVGYKIIKSSASITPNSVVTKVEIYCTDSTRVGIFLSIALPTDLLSQISKSWKFGVRLRLKNVEIQRIDTEYELLITSCTDRTTIEICQCADEFVPPLYLQEEKLRFEALTQSKSKPIVYELLSQSIFCERINCEFHVSELVSSSVNDTIFLKCKDLNEKGITSKKCLLRSYKYQLPSNWQSLCTENANDNAEMLSDCAESRVIVNEVWEISFSLFAKFQDDSNSKETPYGQVILIS